MEIIKPGAMSATLGEAHFFEESMNTAKVRRPVMMMMMMRVMSALCQLAEECVSRKWIGDGLRLQSVFMVSDSPIEGMMTVMEEMIMIVCGVMITVAAIPTDYDDIIV